MSSEKDNTHIRTLYDFASSRGFSESGFFGEENMQQYIDTALDAYRDYALFNLIFKGRYDEKAFSRMMTVDFKSRSGSMVGISSSSSYESVLLMMPPKAKKTGMREYIKSGRIGDYMLLLRPVMYRLENFEKFATAKRAAYLDPNTWYLYLFATKHEYQGKGYGKKLMDLMVSFAKDKGYSLCLETNDHDNVGLYEHFGFKVVEKDMYQDTLEHYIMKF